MSDSEDYDELLEGKEYIPISKHTEKWSDVTPIEQYTKETDPGICKIDYTQDFEDAMKYFRAILHADEISRRALELTQVVIKVNYGCYTAWYYRRKCLDQIGTPEDWKWESKFLNSIGVALEKNYQIWHHRRCIVQTTGDYSKEKEFLEEIFESDDKNYHAWSYRIWLVQHFNLYDGELEFITKMINENPMNNSAWSYRYFIIAKAKEFTKETVQEELNYALKIIKEFKLDNEAPWVYLRGYLARSQEEAERSIKTSSKRIIITEFPFLKEECENMAKEHLEGESGYRFVIILLLDYLIAENNTSKATEFCDLLGEKYDPIRANYWLFRKQQLQGVK